MLFRSSPPGLAGLQTAEGPVSVQWRDLGMPGGEGHLPGRCRSPGAVGAGLSEARARTWAPEGVMERAGAPAGRALPSARGLHSRMASGLPGRLPRPPGLHEPSSLGVRVLDIPLALRGSLAGSGRSRVGQLPWLWRSADLSRHPEGLAGAPWAGWFWAVLVMPFPDVQAAGPWCPLEVS